MLKMLSDSFKNLTIDPQTLLFAAIEANDGFKVEVAINKGAVVSPQMIKDAVNHHTDTSIVVHLLLTYVKQVCPNIKPDYYVQFEEFHVILVYVARYGTPQDNQKLYEKVSIEEKRNLVKHCVAAGDRVIIAAAKSSWDVLPVILSGLSNADFSVLLTQRSDGQTALTLTANQDVQAVNDLLPHNGEVNLPVNEKNTKQETPIDVAARQWQGDIVRRLDSFSGRLSKYPELRIYYNEMGATPFSGISPIDLRYRLSKKIACTCSDFTQHAKLKQAIQAGDSVSVEQQFAEGAQLCSQQLYDVDTVDQATHRVLAKQLERMQRRQCFNLLCHGDKSATTILMKWAQKDYCTLTKAALSNFSIVEIEVLMYHRNNDGVRVIDLVNSAPMFEMLTQQLPRTFLERLLSKQSLNPFYVGSSLTRIALRSSPELCSLVFDKLKPLSPHNPAYAEMLEVLVYRSDTKNKVDLLFRYLPNNVLLPCFWNLWLNRIAKPKYFTDCIRLIPPDERFAYFTETVNVPNIGKIPRFGALVVEEDAQALDALFAGLKAEQIRRFFNLKYKNTAWVHAGVKYFNKKRSSQVDAVFYKYGYPSPEQEHELDLLTKHANGEFVDGVLIYRVLQILPTPLLYNHYMENMGDMFKLQDHQIQMLLSRFDHLQRYSLCGEILKNHDLYNDFIPRSDKFNTPESIFSFVARNDQRLLAVLFAGFTADQKRSIFKITSANERLIMWAYRNHYLHAVRGLLSAGDQLPFEANDLPEVYRIDEELNGKQNTHVVSVHDSLARSAIALVAMYVEMTDQARDILQAWANSKPHLTEDKTLEGMMQELMESEAIQDKLNALMQAHMGEISSWVDENLNILFFDQSFNEVVHKEHSAIRALHYLFNVTEYQEEHTLLTLAQLFVLVWVACPVHGRNNLKQHLYEIARAYNLDLENKEKVLNARDLCASFSGAFNNLVLSLNGLNDAVHFIFVNRAVVNLKAISLVAQLFNVHDFTPDEMREIKAVFFEDEMYVVSQIVQAKLYIPIYDELRKVFDEFVAAGFLDDAMYYEAIANAFSRLNKDAIKIIRDKLLAHQVAAPAVLPGFVASRGSDDDDNDNGNQILAVQRCNLP